MYLIAERMQQRFCLGTLHILHARPAMLSSFEAVCQAQAAFIMFPATLEPLLLCLQQLWCVCGPSCVLSSTVDMLYGSVHQSTSQQLVCATTLTQTPGLLQQQSAYGRLLENKQRASSDATADLQPTGKALHRHHQSLMISTHQRQCQHEMQKHNHQLMRLCGSDLAMFSSFRGSPSL